MDHSYENKVLFDSFKIGEAKAFDLIFKSYRKMIYMYSYELLKDEDETEDVTIDTFTALWQQFNELQNSVKSLDHMINWLFTVARNKSFNILKRSGRKKVVYDETKPAAEWPTTVPDYERIHAEFMDLIWKEVDSLPDQMRKVFIMRYSMGLRAQEVATRMGLDVETVYSHSKKALQKLRIRLSDQWPEATVAVIICCLSNH